MVVKIIHLLCLIAFSVGLIVPSFEYRDDYVWSEELNGWLKYHEVPSSWRDARLRCQLEGAELAWPKSKLMMMKMTELVTENRQEQDVFYIGISDELSRGDFLAVDGTPLANIVHKFVDFITELKESKKCLTLSTQHGLMHQWDCDNMLTYICYKKYSNVVVNDCGTTDPGYQYNEATGSCYKFHKHGRVWPEALMTCISEQATLAVINSNTEANVLKDIFAKYPENVLPRYLPHKYAVCIGHHSLYQDNNWLTLEGKSLKDSGYDNWENGQPDNYNNEQHCGAMFRNSKLDDYYCKLPCAFICEKKMEKEVNVTLDFRSVE